MLLFVDNCPVHPTYIPLENIKLVFFFFYHQMQQVICSYWIKELLRFKKKIIEKKQIAFTKWKAKIPKIPKLFFPSNTIFYRYFLLVSMRRSS